MLRFKCTGVRSHVRWWLRRGYSCLVFSLHNRFSRLRLRRLKGAFTNTLVLRSQLWIFAALLWPNLPSRLCKQSSSKFSLRDSETFYTNVFWSKFKGEIWSITHQWTFNSPHALNPTVHISDARVLPVHDYSSVFFLYYLKSFHKCQISLDVKIL